MGRAGGRLGLGAREVAVDQVAAVVTAAVGLAYVSPVARRRVEMGTPSKSSPNRTSSQLLLHRAIRSRVLVLAQSDTLR